MKDSSNILLGALAGVAAGFVLAILLKPKQIVPVQKQTRPLLNGFGNHISNRVNEALNPQFQTYTDDFDDHVEHTSF